VKTFPWKEFLQKHPMFSTVRDDASFDALLEETASTEQILGRDTVILRQGEISDAVFVIGSGSAEALLSTGDGTQLALATMREGEVFGEMGALERRARSATVRTQEPSIILEVHGPQFRQLMREHPGVELWLLLKMSQRLRSVNERLEELHVALERRVEERTADLAALTAQLKASNARLMELDQLKSDFVSDVAHELRTPLTAIKGYVDYLLDGAAGEVTPAQRGFLQTVRRNAERQTRLINDLLDLARIETGRVEFHPTQLSLSEIVEEVIDVLRVHAAESEIDLAGAVQEPDLVVAADRDKLHQVLLNLTHNAVKFTPAGGSVRVRARRGNEKTVVITVEDTGEGIAPEDIGRVFERFYRIGDPEATPKGSGLGLTITKKLVELHGGSIRVTSEVGQGSVFVITLPAGVREPA
jgi:signal transduction histidine kinase